MADDGFCEFSPDASARTSGVSPSVPLLLPSLKRGYRSTDLDVGSASLLRLHLAPSVLFPPLSACCLIPGEENDYVIKTPMIHAGGSGPTGLALQGSVSPVLSESERPRFDSCTRFLRSNPCLISTPIAYSCFVAGYLVDYKIGHVSMPRDVLCFAVVGHPPGRERVLNRHQVICRKICSKAVRISINHCGEGGAPPRRRAICDVLVDMRPSPTITEKMSSGDVSSPG